MISRGAFMAPRGSFMASRARMQGGRMDRDASGLMKPAGILKPAGVLEPAALRCLGAAEAEDLLAGLADLLVDAVASGASVNFLRGLTREEAAAWWRRAALPGLASGERVLIVAEREGSLVGTVQVAFATQPNQPHRADVAKMIVRGTERRRGLGGRLLARAEAVALAAGRTLLTLDTESGSAGERLYRAAGWVPAGTIPGYALTPDGIPAAATFFYKAIGPQPA